MKARILYIEDDPRNYHLVESILTAEGHEVLGAKTGREGLEEAARANPDLVLMDIRLPLMEGNALARAFRADPRLSRIPIVALTSYSVAGDSEETLESGCDAAIEKPIDPASFAAQVERFLPRGAPPGEGR